MKSKRINIRATEQEHKEANEVVKEGGFKSLASFFWHCVNLFKKKG